MGAIVSRPRSTSILELVRFAIWLIHIYLLGLYCQTSASRERKTERIQPSRYRSAQTSENLNEMRAVQAVSQVIDSANVRNYGEPQAAKTVSYTHLTLPTK